MPSYAGKKAVVVGGTHGIGRAIVDALLDGGAEVLLTGRNGERLDASRRELAGRVQVVASDITSLAEIDALDVFVVTTSIADETGPPGMSVYSGSKAALRAFTRVFAAELLPRGIRVNAVSPGFIRTPTMGIAGASTEELAAFEQEGSTVTPMGRVGAPGEVAAAALFLAFHATFTTATEVPVDGGLAQQLGAPHP